MAMTAADDRTLASILDEIIPPSEDGRLPGAGALGIATHITRAVERTPELAFTIEPGVAAADALAEERHGRRFAALARAERLEVLRALEAAQPALIPTLTFHAYVGYYQHPRVVEGLGMEARPPHPRGYEMQPNDLGLLDAVRRRAKLYRDV
jgi:hypothetical protein